MADSKIPKSLASDLNTLETNTKHKTTTVTGTTDNNGFLTTSLDSRTNIPLTVTNLKLDNVVKAPFFVDFLLRGGNGYQIAMKFRTWDETVFKGTMEVTLVYEEIRS